MVCIPRFQHTMRLEKVRRRDWSQVQIPTQTTWIGGMGGSKRTYICSLMFQCFPEEILKSQVITYAATNFFERKISLRICFSGKLEHNSPMCYRQHSRLPWKRDSHLVEGTILKILHPRQIIVQVYILVRWSLSPCPFRRIQISVNDVFMFCLL